MTRSQILRLFGQHGLQDLFRNPQVNTLGNAPQDDEEEDDGCTGRSGRRRRRGQPTPSRYAPIPSEQGKRLMSSGTFGETGFYEDKLRNRKDRLARRLIYRELGISQGPPARANKLISQVECSVNTGIRSSSRSGSYTFFKCGHHHPLQRSLLLRPIL